MTDLLGDVERSREHVTRRRANRRTPRTRRPGPQAARLEESLLWWPIGVAAAGVILYFVGAVTYRVRAHDMQVAAPLVILLVAIAALALRAVTV